MLVLYWGYVLCEWSSLESMAQVTAILFMRKFIFKETFFAYIKTVKNPKKKKKQKLDLSIHDLVVIDSIFLTLNLRQEFC